MSKFHVFKNATLIHSKSRCELELLSNISLVIEKASGKIIAQTQSLSEIQQYLTEKTEVTTLKANQFFIPGFVDTHTHAPQFAFIGTGLDLPLIEWLLKYTFPCEQKFADLQYAQKIYTRCIDEHMRQGTTTICFYGTIHLEATKLLASIADKFGIRAFIGKVCMDRNAPTTYVETTEQSIRDTEELINFCENQQFSLVKPVITPRFAPCCTSDLLKRLGQMAKSHDLLIQTHLAENKQEIAWNKVLFPEYINYTDVYQKHNLLGSKTILAHCIYLGNEECQQILEQGSGISHCPNSNTSLQSGIMPARKYLKKGIKMGLGTDVAGGYSSSILDAIRQCLGVSKLYSVVIDPSDSPLTVDEAFYLATQGGAELVSLGDKIGTFAVEKEFDAQLIEFDNPFNGEEDWKDSFQRFIYSGDDRNVKQVFIKGKCVYSQMI